MLWEPLGSLILKPNLVWYLEICCYSYKTKTIYIY